MSFHQKIVRSSEITPKAVFENRRQLIQSAAAGAFGLALVPWFSREALANSPQKLPATPNPTFTVSDEPTAYKHVTSYNNFYEFGTDKTDPFVHAGSLQTRPWTVTIEGLVKKPVTLDIDALLKLAPIEERVYRMRCVEGWSMVIPWDGYSLSKLLNYVQPLGSAKYVEFISLADRKQMPGLKSQIIEWPYREGLRLDEAMNPLTLLTFGLYGEVLPKQNGAPVRIVVPWKYGFKSAKSIVKIRFTDKAPATAWNKAARNEYGFYSNVNPKVDHPRWSQATEELIGFNERRPTLLFNGYGDEVASLYQGMDLRKWY